MFESASAPVRANWKLRVVFAAFTLILIWAFVWLLRMTQMPLRSYRGARPALSREQADLADRLSADVKYLSVTVGERNIQRVGSLKATAEYLGGNLRRAGYVVNERNYSVDVQVVSNVEVTLPGSDSASGTVVVGAHYDSVSGTVGANDNATGVAGVLELARLLQGSKPRRTIRFVLFVNEEPPYFQTENMGSLVYARQLRQEHVPVAAMISLETIGFYSDTPGSQKYPPPKGAFYPNRGDFIGFVGEPESRELVRRYVRKFREAASFPSEGVAAPGDWPGIGWSDHWSFWQEKYPAIMITDTAPFRYPYYHTPHDTFDKVDFAKMARVVDGVRQVVESLASDSSGGAEARGQTKFGSQRLKRCATRTRSQSCFISR
jgi:Peptidase family M28